jgi:hypothetical protein
MVRQVKPLRISKGTPGSSPNKPRPLSEVGNTEHRRNSPIYNQATRVCPRILVVMVYVDLLTHLLLLTEGHRLDRILSANRNLVLHEGRITARILPGP